MLYIARVTTVTFALLGIGAGLSDVHAADDLQSLGLQWLEVGKRPGDCRVVAVTPTYQESTTFAASFSAEAAPLVNPYSHNAYAVGKRGKCPSSLEGGIELSIYTKYAVRDGGLRLYMPWGRSSIFKFYPHVEGWGHENRYRFGWLDAE